MTVEFDLAVSRQNKADTKSKLLTTVLFTAVMIFQMVTAVYAVEITVNDFTDESIQEAVDKASVGDIVFLPAGDYYFDYTVIIDKSITLTGAAELMNVGVVEPGETNDPPYWDSAHSNCYTDIPNRTLFRVDSDAVTFRNLQLSGAITHEEGYGMGITVTEYNQLTVENCVLTHFLKGVNYVNSLQNVVNGCYLIENFRDGYGYGLCVVGESMNTGGSQVTITNNEFSFNRHGIASNSPETSLFIENNYFHDNDMSQRQACVDTHPQGGYTLRAVVRNNIFERTNPMSFQSGSLEITGNYFDPGCGNYDIGGSSRMINFDIPAHNGDEVPTAALHDIYIADNINDSSPHRRMIWVKNYDYSGITKFVAYNMFIDGDLFKFNSDLSYPPEYPYSGSSPNPFVGHMYVTLPGESEPVYAVKSNVWYDLHVFAVDPEGAENIAEIGAQLINTNLYARNADVAVNQGEFSAVGNYFIRGSETSVYARETESSSAWTDITAEEGMYVDGAESHWQADGGHRIHFTARLKVPDQAVGGEWRLYGYARDKDANLPISAWNEFSEGWKINVDSDALTSVDDSAPQELVLFDRNYPNPFNPSTTISYTLNAPGRITMTVYDMLGRKVNTLVDEMKTPGSYTVRWDAENQASGMYFCKINYGESVHLTQKMLLIK